MTTEEALKQYKSLFPDNVETIVLTKEDYDRQLGKLQYENIELQERIDKAIEDLEKAKELNDKHILARDNIVIHLDIDHIEYLLNILKGNYDKE